MTAADDSETDGPERPDGQPPLVTDELADVASMLAEANSLLLCLDFDGTLAPIVDEPTAAGMLPEAREALERLRDHPDVEIAFVSGRALDDLRERVGMTGVHYAGNHGLEYVIDGEETVHPAARDHRPALEAVVEDLREVLASVSGAHVEDKEVTATVHYRQTPDERVERVREAVRNAVEERTGLRLTEGKDIRELRPAVECDKGTAVRRLDADGALSMYVGDDTTDEAAFRAVVPDGVAVHVGDRADTAATHRLADPAAVAEFLAWLATEGTARLERDAEDAGPP